MYDFCNTISYHGDDNMHSVHFTLPTDSSLGCMNLYLKIDERSMNASVQEIGNNSVALICCHRGNPIGGLKNMYRVLPNIGMVIHKMHNTHTYKPNPVAQHCTEYPACKLRFIAFQLSCISKSLSPPFDDRKKNGRVTRIVLNIVLDYLISSKNRSSSFTFPPLYPSLNNFPELCRK